MLVINHSVGSTYGSNLCIQKILSEYNEMKFMKKVYVMIFQMLMNRLHREGVQMLSISELQFLNRHMSPTQIDKEVDVESLKTSWESEKQSLLSAIQSLKDLLAQTHKLRGLEKV